MYSSELFKKDPLCAICTSYCNFAIFTTIASCGPARKILPPSQYYVHIASYHPIRSALSLAAGQHCTCPGFISWSICTQNYSYATIRPTSLTTIMHAVPTIVLFLLAYIDKNNYNGAQHAPHIFLLKTFSCLPVVTLGESHDT